MPTPVSSSPFAGGLLLRDSPNAAQQHQRSDGGIAFSNPGLRGADRIIERFLLGFHLGFGGSSDSG